MSCVQGPPLPSKGVPPEVLVAFLDAFSLFPEKGLDHACAGRLLISESKYAAVSSSHIVVPREIDLGCAEYRQGARNRKITPKRSLPADEKGNFGKLINRPFTGRNNGNCDCRGFHTGLRGKK